MSKVIKIVQFGEGRFLRAFADVFFEEVSQSVNDTLKVVMISPRGRKSEGVVKEFREQECRYTVCIQGLRNGKYVEEFRVVNCIENLLDPVREYDRYIHESEDPDLELILSNTTENGIRYDPEDRMNDMPQKSYPAKLTAFLYHRFCTFEGDPNKAPIILASELIDNNAELLKKIVKKYCADWNLPPDYLKWLDACSFCSSLVDRIVVGYPDNPEQYFDKMGYQDRFLDVAEPFSLWAIKDNDKRLKGLFPWDCLNLPVVFTDELQAYTERKVGILNASHILIAHVGIQLGYSLVREAIEDNEVKKYILRYMYTEVIPFLSLDESETTQFAMETIERFSNPYIDHKLSEIAKNSLLKWKIRCWPRVIKYHQQFGRVPEYAAFGFASMLRNLDEPGNSKWVKVDPISDDALEKEFIELTKLYGELIEKKGMKQALEVLLEKNEVH